MNELKTNEFIEREKVKVRLETDEKEKQKNYLKKTDPHTHARTHTNKET